MTEYGAPERKFHRPDKGLVVSEGGKISFAMDASSVYLRVSTWHSPPFCPLTRQVPYPHIAMDERSSGKSDRVDFTSQTMLALFRRITYAYLWRYRRAEAVSDRIQTNESSVLCADGGGTPAHAQDVPAARSLSVMDDGDRDCGA